MSRPKLQNLNHWQRATALWVIYSVVLVTATWLAYGLRFDFVVPPYNQIQIGRIWVWVWAIKLVALASAGQFSSLLSFFSLPDLKRLGLALGAVTVGLLGWWYLSDEVYGMSRGVIIIDGILSFLFLATCRVGFRLVREGIGSGSGESSAKRVGIVGAGEIGAALARELQTKGTLKPVFFFDDSTQIKGTKVHGIPILGPVEILRAPNAPELSEVIIAMPSSSASRIREVVEVLDELDIQYRTVPSISQIALGEVVTQLRPVEIGDILGRETVYLDPEELREFFEDKTVLVTGAGGSIGSELCRQLVGLGLPRLILVDHSEFQLFEIHSELSGTEVELIPEVLDVQDATAIESALKRHGPAVIFHAAAYKHVSLMERQPMMAIRNNVLATHQLARAAAEQGVEHFILISTDKAVAPSSVMGATKHLAEQALQGHALGDTRTCFVTVRFGNVLGSSGSVVPIFQRQIDMGGPVKVTDEAATRFFMSIPEAAGLVLRSAAIGKNRDRFILDMGQPIRIMDLAKEMIRLSGYGVGEDMEIQIIGLRKGEKLHEELHSTDEQLVDTAHPKIKRIQGAELTAGQWSTLEAALLTASDLDDSTALGWLHKVLPDFRPE